MYLTPYMPIVRVDGRRSERTKECTIEGIQNA